MKGVVERMKNSKVMRRLLRSVSSKYSKLMNYLTCTLSTRKKANLTIASATQQKLVFTPTDNVKVHEERIEQGERVVKLTATKGEPVRRPRATGVNPGRAYKLTATTERSLPLPDPDHGQGAPYH